MSINRKMEWGVQYGDGGIDDGLIDEAEARRIITDHRALIGEGLQDAADYEPMTAVRREVVLEVGAWELR